MRALSFGFVLVLALPLTPLRASAQATLVSGLGGAAGYGTQCLGINDDGSSNPIDITPYFPGGLRFFGTTHTQLFVNTNGNVTFSGPLPTYTPAAFPVASRPMIAPFWADVDTRPDSGVFETCDGPGDGEAVLGPPCDNPSENGVWWHFSAASGGMPARAIMTWDRVGYYRCHLDQRMSFQLILTEVIGCGSGSGGADFDVEFRFNRCEWETGDQSGGSGGFGGTPAQSGFDAGDRVNFVEIAMSRTRGIASRLCTMSNVGDPGVWRFSIRGGAVMCPEAGMPCDTTMSGICSQGRVSCDCSGASCSASCVSQIMPRMERCNALDDDCDGTVDDGDEGMLCGADEICERGRCIGRCFEGGCVAGFVCAATGCIEEACAEVPCPPGERCRGGSCIPACDGVTCPIGLSCIGGVCVDTCEGIGCDMCTTCVAGACVARCDRGGSCPSGETCEPASGRCVPSDCAGVSCEAGTVCRAGNCIDACEGAICPEGETCRMGECVLVPRDGSDGGSLSTFDGGSDEGDPDGRRSRRPASGCGCAAGGVSLPARAAITLVLSIGALLVARRRRGSDGGRACRATRRCRCDAR